MDITIEPFGTHHLDATYLWIQDPALRHDFMFTTTVTEQSHRNWYERIQHDSSQAIWAICVDGEHVGNLGLKDIEPHRAELWIYIGQTSVRGRGVAQRAIGLLCDAYNSSKDELYARVAHWNTASRQMFKRAGFIEQQQQPQEVVIWVTKKLE